MAARAAVYGFLFSVTAFISTDIDICISVIIQSVIFFFNGYSYLFYGWDSEGLAKFSKVTWTKSTAGET